MLRALKLFLMVCFLISSADSQERYAIKTVQFKLTQATAPGYIAVNVTLCGKGGQAVISSTCDSNHQGFTVVLSPEESRCFFDSPILRAGLSRVQSWDSDLKGLTLKDPFAPFLRVATLTEGDKPTEFVIHQEVSEDSRGFIRWALCESLVGKLIHRLPESGRGHFTQAFLNYIDQLAISASTQTLH